MGERRERRRINALFGDRGRTLVVCDEGVFLHERPPTPNDPHDKLGASEGGFVAVTRLQEEQAVRCVEFHPSGEFYAVGANSRALRICAYPRKDSRREDARSPTVLLSRPRLHKGSLYCVAWNATGDLLATGSNDKTLRLMRFDPTNCQLEEGASVVHAGGTVRDACFMEDVSSHSNLLISGGADARLFVTDCETATPFQALSGHTGPVKALCTWGGVMFVSSSVDRSIRFWDMRTRGCVHHIPARPAGGDTGGGSAAGSLAADPSGRLLVSGHEDGSCLLYDMRGRRPLQTFLPSPGHPPKECRSVRLSPHALYLLTGGHDGALVLTDLQGDLTQPLSSVRVAEHSDKVIQGRWHPKDFTFASTSADKTCVVWALPPV